MGRTSPIKQPQAWVIPDSVEEAKATLGDPDVAPIHLCSDAGARDTMDGCFRRRPEAPDLATELPLSAVTATLDPNTKP